MPEGNNAMPFMHVVARVAVCLCAGRLTEASSGCSEFFEMARRLELPRGHPIWREASYWLTVTGMQQAIAPDSRAALAFKHLTNMLVSERMGPSNACVLEAFDLNVEMLVEASRDVRSSEALQVFCVRVHAFTVLLTGVLYVKQHLPMLSWRGLQVTVQRMFARLAAALVCAGSMSSVPGFVALAAARLLALHPHDFASRPVLVFAPQTEHGRYILETFVLSDTVQHGLLREIVVSAEDAGGAVVLPTDELQLSETLPTLAILRDPDTLDVLDCHLWCSRALLALSKPSPDTIAAQRTSFAEAVDATRNKGAAPPQRVSSKPLLKPVAAAPSAPLWKIGAAVAVAAVAVGAVWYVWNRGTAREN